MYVYVMRIRPRLSSGSASKVLCNGVPLRKAIGECLQLSRFSVVFQKCSFYGANLICDNEALLVLRKSPFSLGCIVAIDGVGGFDGCGGCGGNDANEGKTSGAYSNGTDVNGTTGCGIVSSNGAEFDTNDAEFDTKALKFGIVFVDDGDATAVVGAAIATAAGAGAAAASHDGGRDAVPATDGATDTGGPAAAAATGKRQRDGATVSATSCATAAITGERHRDGATAATAMACGGLPRRGRLRRERRDVRGARPQPKSRG
jgi:hypothetical protein